VDNKFIYVNDKYQIDALNKDWIGLPVFFENLPEEIKIKGDTFYFPTPFHISLVYIGKIIEKYNISIPDFRDKIIDDFSNFTKTDNIEVIKYNNKYKLVSRDGINKTIVVMCEVSNLNNFFDFINKKYELNIKYPATHVTLYNTSKGKSGIWLMDEDDIKNITVTIPNPIGRPL